MALTNTQFDEIMRRYDATQLRNRHILEERIRLTYIKEPRLQEIDHAISSVSLVCAKKRLDGDMQAISDLKDQIEEYRRQRIALLSSHGYPSNYLDPIYTCSDCKDTGYVNGIKCHCLRQAIIDKVYTQSNIREALSKENFSTFCFDYYPEDQLSPTTGLSARETAKQAVAQCHNFINTFDSTPSNLLLFGDIGVGKTFLTNCIAKEILDQCHSVIYFTAFQLFDILSKGIFEKDTDAIATHQNIFDCDLLIIDDLGTELSNSFTASQLFLIINERILRKKSTIISTNLNLNRIRDLYSERTLSRISSNYTIIKLFGDDIRIRKRRG